MLSPQLKDLSLLLEVFREGLRLGIISKKEVIAWADGMIAKHDEPDHFFIELSLGSNTNKLIEVLNEFVINTDNPICRRVLFGRIYEQMIADNDVAKVEDIARQVSGLQYWNIGLTEFEVSKLYQFDDYDIYYLPDITQLQVEIINFLAIYKPFTLENYNQWDEINTSVLAVLKEEEAREAIANAAFIKSWERQAKKRRLKRILLRSVPFLILAVILVIMYVPFPGSSNYPPDDILPNTLRFTALLFILYRCGKYLVDRVRKRG